MEIEEMEERGDPLPSSQLVVAVAVNGNKSSKYALKWALDKFIPEGRIFFRLVYVRPKITMVPTPMGNYLPISKVRDDVVSAYRREIEWQTNSMLQPYKRMCNQKQVEAEVVVIEADDVAEAISEEVNKFTVSKLVIGVSSGIFCRKFRGSKMSSKISECIPRFCTMYVISKGKLALVHASASGTTESTIGESTQSVASYSSLSHSSSELSEWMDSGQSSNFSRPRSPSLSNQRNQAVKVTNKSFVDRSFAPGGKLYSRCVSVTTDEDFMSSISNISDVPSVNSPPSNFTSSEVDVHSLNSDQASTSTVINDCSAPQSEVNVDFELERLRIELRHLQGVYEIAQHEACDATRQLDELSVRREEEAMKLNEIRIREAMARRRAQKERELREAAEKEAEYVKECAEMEAQKRIDAEENADREIMEKERLERALEHTNKKYNKYTWDEIEAATCSFSADLKIGSGSNGSVYKASFHHTVAAVKILHSNEGKGTKQFKQELEILGRIRHPHLLLLLGACPDHGCLIYEYMENGSLEDRLQHKNNSPSLPWYHRFRIAWEIASALVFLHNSKPDPIIHRDLKPANILLDSNLVSKIGDVGLSTLLPTTTFTMSTMYKDTAPAGTFFYIDPEYQRTGQLSQKSDTYALGMVILQLITGKPPMALAHIVETAIEGGFLASVLDSGAGEWPSEETKELAVLGLSCLELRRKDRPELNDVVLPVLERLKGFANTAQDLFCHVPSVAPSHFFCPILQEVMEDPCVASDGYTYERRAIEKWFSMNDKSPMTNMKLLSKILIPNHSLLSAIKSWKRESN